MGKLAAILLLFAATAYSQAAADPYAGVFTSKDLRLELRPSALFQYTGTIEVSGERFPVTASFGRQGLSGKFTAGGQAFAFTALVAGDQMRLVSDGNTHDLNREGPGAGRTNPNPLGMGRQSGGAMAGAPRPQPAGESTWSPQQAAVAATGPYHTHSMGVRIRPAAGWTAKDVDQGIQLAPPGGTQQEVYIAAVQEGYSPAEESRTVAQLSQAFLQNGGQANRAGIRESFSGGASYYWEAADPSTGSTVGLKIYFTPAGSRANVIIAYGVAASIQRRDVELRSMLATLSQGSAPAGAAGGLADNTPLAQQWLAKLRGRMIRQMSAYQGMSSDKRHYLNADGSYAYRSQSMVSVDVGGASGLSSGGSNLRGRWRIHDVGGTIYLRIQYSDGDTGQYRLTQDGRNWYMNGEKAFAVDPE